MNACRDYEIGLWKKHGLELADHYYQLYLKEVNHTAKAAKRIHDRGREVLDNIKPGPCPTCKERQRQLDSLILRTCDLEDELWDAQRSLKKKRTRSFSSIVSWVRRSLSSLARFATRARRSGRS
jgi:hypothetical protein